MKAIALFSGGLDSCLAVKLISEQGVSLTGVHFQTLFNTPDVTERIKALGENLNIDIRILNLGEKILEILKAPRHGYGKNMNPCIDCRILSLRKAYELMQEIGAKFLVTGEVLGQRPMSQNKSAMELIEKESGTSRFLVRPLSAKLLTPTIPEEEGWINREKLLDIEGRSRKSQLELAKKYKISGYSSPSGGCLLTDPGFSSRIKDLLDSDMLSVHSANLVKVGRYFKITDCFKLMVGRNHEENLKLAKLVGEQDVVLEPEAKGPVAIGFGEAYDKSLYIASQIVAYYCKYEGEITNVKVFKDNELTSLSVNKINEQKLLEYRV